MFSSLTKLFRQETSSDSRPTESNRKPPAEPEPTAESDINVGRTSTMSDAKPNKKDYKEVEPQWTKYVKPPKTKQQPNDGTTAKFLDVSKLPMGAQCIIVNGPFVQFICGTCGCFLASRSLHDHWEKAHKDREGEIGLLNMVAYGNNKLMRIDRKYEKVGKAVNKSEEPTIPAQQNKEKGDKTPQESEGRWVECNQKLWDSHTKFGVPSAENIIALQEMSKETLATFGHMSTVGFDSKGKVTDWFETKIDDTVYRHQKEWCRVEHQTEKAEDDKVANVGEDKSSNKRTNNHSDSNYNDNEVEVVEEPSAKKPKKENPFILWCQSMGDATLAKMTKKDLRLALRTQEHSLKKAEIGPAMDFTEELELADS